MFVLRASPNTKAKKENPLKKSPISQAAQAKPIFTNDMYP